MFDGLQWGPWKGFYEMPWILSDGCKPDSCSYSSPIVSEPFSWKAWPKSFQRVKLRYRCPDVLIVECWARLYTQRSLFKTILNQPEIRLYLPFFDWFGSKRTTVWIPINRKMVNTIWFRLDLIRFRKDFSVCRFSQERTSESINCPYSSNHTKYDCLYNLFVYFFFFLTRLYSVWSRKNQSEKL